MLLTTSWICDLLILIGVGVFMLYRYFHQSFQYWSKRNVYSPPTTPIFGHFMEVFLYRLCVGEWLKKYYDNVNEKFFGLYLFNEPFLVVKDPEIVQHILVKDFSNFSNKNVASPKHDPLQKQLLFLAEDSDWKFIKAQMGTMFSSGRLKTTFNVLNATGKDFQEWLSNNLGEHEAKELVGRYATEVVAKSAYGIDVHSFSQEEPVFSKQAHKLFGISLRNSFSQTLYVLKKNWVHMLKLNFVDKKLLKYFSKIILETLKLRQDDQHHNDIIDVIKKLKRSGQLSDDQQCASLAINFLLGGVETVSSTISFALYEFCLNKDIQNTARNEIHTVLSRYGGELTFEAVKEMTYLKMCLDETLRKYPVLPVVDRMCNKDYKIPGTDVVIEKGTPVLIPMYPLQMDENNFPEPFKFDPERFLDQNIYQKTGYYLPFGIGPRMCIGDRLGILVCTVALVHILNNFEVEKSSKTPDELVFDSRSLLIISNVGIPMKFNALKN